MAIRIVPSPQLPLIDHQSTKPLKMVQDPLMVAAPILPDKGEPRSLTIWCPDSTSKVFTSLAPILSQAFDFPVNVVNDVTKMPKGSVILCLGSAGKQVLEQVKLVRKGCTIASLRNKVTMCGDVPVLFSYSPGIGDIDYALKVELLCDTRLALRYAMTGKYTPTMGKYEWVQDFSQLIAEIEAKYTATGKPVDLCYDTETKGTDWLDLQARFVTLQFSMKKGTGCAVFFPNPEAAMAAKGGLIRQQLQWLLTTDKVSLRAANGKFDMVWTWYHFNIECSNFKFDTTLVGNLLDENRSNSLDVHAKVYTNLGGYSDEFDNTVDKSKMDELPQDQKLLDYACGDVDAGLQASEAMKVELLKNKKLTNLYVNILHPAARAFEVIERGGVYVDTEAYDELRSTLTKELDRLTSKAVEILGGRIYAKHRDPSKPGGINLTKAALLKDFMFSPMGLDLRPQMFTEKTNEPSSSHEHMLMFEDVPEAAEFVTILDEYSKASKTLTTYVDGFREHIRSDGRFHPTYFLYKGRDFGFKDEGGTVTGRLSAKDPAIQTVPKKTKWGKLLRKIFKAPPGYVMLERDYSQGELRVVACIANEQAMIQAYKEGKDLHVLTGAYIVGMTYEAVMALKETDPAKFDAIRQPAKPANFGLLYGQGAEGFMHYAWSNYRVKMTLEEAEHARNRFFQLYPQLPRYHEEYKAFAHKYGYVTSPLGRIRRCPLINSKNRSIQGEEERKIINAPVQGMLNDLMLWALGIEHKEGGFKTAPVFAVIHDAAYDYIPEDKDVVSIVEHKRELMENLPFEKMGWKPQLSFLADCKVGKNMAELKEQKRKAA
jgi:DNA polymerase I-like protein with 3'-5' exonuclease and polymerase domains